MTNLVIIGGGPAGYESAIKAKKAGFNVTLIEKNELGGVCLWEGCIPTKTLLHSALFYESLKNGSSLGVELENYNLNINTIKKRKDSVITSLNQGIHFQMQQNDIHVIKGYGKIISPNQVEVNGNIINADYIFIATGSTNKLLPFLKKDIENVFYSTDLLNLNSVPSSLGIIGSGVIGSEFASLFSALGSEVTIFEALDKFLPILDSDISKRMSAALKRQKISIHTNVLVKDMTNIGNQVLVTYLEKEKEKEKVFDQVLIAIGRVPNINEKELQDIGIVFNNKGIEVNNDFQTNIKNIYAIGDVNGLSLLAHSAIFQGEVALNHILNKSHSISFDATPNVIFTSPEVAYVGEKEDDLIKGEYLVYKSFYSANGMAFLQEKVFGFAKVITNLNNEIIGAAILGEGASLLIAEMVVAINNKMSLTSFKEVIHAHPTLSEIWQNIE